MTRTLDVKALVSHIVRGDGVDRCRICMGETSQGQVFLEDTVMLDGERPVTLAELLETLTGLEVELDGLLPSTLCETCSNSAITAGTFRNFCRESQQLWQNSINTLTTLPESNKGLNKEKQIYAFLNRNLDNMIVNTKWKKEVEEKDKKVKCTCPDCGKQFHYLYLLQTHLLEAGINRRVCLYCSTVTNCTKMIDHMNKMHKREHYFCSICHSAFKSKGNLEKHAEDYHSGSFSCGDCARSFESQQSLTAHSIVHRMKVCSNCNTQFMNMPCYLYHVQNCQSGAGALKPTASECFCDYCGKRFSGKKYLKAHIVIVHSRTTHSPCSVCGKYLAAAHMSTHIKLNHVTQTAKICPICGIALKSDLGLKQHKRLHTGEKPYKCTFCELRFSASSRRSEHIQKMHQPGHDFLKHECDSCPAKFRLPYQLRKHNLLVHSQSNPSDFEFGCDVCGVKFGSCRGLVHHKRKHQQIHFFNSV